MKRGRTALVGGFVVGALLIAIAGLIILGGGRLFRRSHIVVAYFRTTVHGLDKGAPVKFKGVEIGSVYDVLINISKLPRRPEELRIPVLIALDANKLRRGGASVDLDDPATISRFVDDGLRAKIASISFITGLRYVALDVIPGSPADMVADPTVPYPEIPTIAGELEGAEQEVLGLVSALTALDYQRLFHSLDDALGSARKTADAATKLLEDVDELVRAPEVREATRNARDLTAHLDAAIGEFRQIQKQLAQGGPIAKNVELVTENAARALDRAAAAAAGLNGLVHPDSRVIVQLQQTLGDLSSAARSLRRLTDQLDRDPAALLRGRSP
jgi:paraquat-inducible protein B